MCWKVDDREFRGICAGAPQAKKGDFWLLPGLLLWKESSLCSKTDIRAGTVEYGKQWIWELWVTPGVPIFHLHIPCYHEYCLLRTGMEFCMLEITKCSFTGNSVDPLFSW
jgi:hypothetical protein